MTPPTLWPARRVGDRILCGRMHLPDKRHVCQGELAKVATTPADPTGRVAFPPGFVEDPPGFMHPVARAARKIADGFAPEHGRKPIWREVPARGLPSDLLAGHPEAFGRQWVAGEGVTPTLPVRARCPHPNCRALAIIEAHLLE